MPHAATAHSASHSRRLTTIAPPGAPITVLSGATGGIGRPLARRLAAANHVLVLLGRNGARLEDAALALTAETDNPDIYWVPCDLSDLQSVRAAATELHAALPHIDAWVSNAGVFAGAYEETVDGFERHLQVNFLAPFLLTHLLLPALRKAPHPRVVLVAGETARLAHLRLSDLNRRQRFSVLGAYGQSKLALVMFSRMLADHESPHLAVNALQPAMAATDHLAAGPRWLNRAWRALSPGPDLGAKAVARLALRPQPQAKTKRYYIGRWWMPAPFAAYRNSKAAALYALAADFVSVPENLTLRPGGA